MAVALSLVALLLVSEPEPEPEPASAPAPAPAPSESPPVEAPPPVATQADIARLEAKLAELSATNDELTERLETMEEEQVATTTRVDDLLPIKGRIGGYVDFGMFWVNGNGSGIRTDLGNRIFPKYTGVVPDPWVFVGDPLSTAINSRGEPPDTSDSRAVAFDAIDNKGKASFIVNAVNVRLSGNMGPTFSVNAMLDFLPRNRNVSDPNGLFLGDYVDVKLAYMAWAPRTKRFKLELQAGKIDPVPGYEYRIQESTERITVTPSLICRYLCGRPVGIKLRQQFFDQTLVLALSFTNGSPIWEGFGFASDVDRNNMKTGAGRLSYRLPIDATVEFAASGLFGAQDMQSDDHVYHWQAGADLHVQWGRIDLAGEFLKGHVDGKTSPGAVRCDAAACLDYMGAYGLLGVRATNWLMPYLRGDWRDALHQNGASFVYVSKLARVTAGLRFEIGTHVIMKAEYTHTRELGPIPQFNNDVLTSSFIGRF